ncbi:MAG: hypothetical protein WD049_03725 [Candidatus Paceibacterota bacterium]
MKKYFSMYAAITTAAVFTPIVTFAQLDEVTNLVTSVQEIINLLIPIAFGLIVVAFFYGLARYVFNADNEDARDQGKRIMVGGVIALTVAALIWGIVAFIGDQLGIDEQGDQSVPTVSLNR